MLNYKTFIKTTNAYKTLDMDINSSRISHAYLFTSVDDNYLYSFAEEFSKMLININEDKNIQNNNSRIEKGIFPDVIVYGKESSIDAQKVNEIVEKSQVSPFEADKKIFVLLNVQNMNEISQNKILKTIEEPPKNTFFILCANETTRILQTILSRVKKIDLDEIDSVIISKMLIDFGVEEGRAEICANCSNGNASFAEKLSNDNSFVEFFNKIVSCFFYINGSRDVLQFSNYFTAKNIDKNEFFNVSLLILRDLAYILAESENLVVCKNIFDKLKLIAVSLNLSSITILIDTCIMAKKDLLFNTNPTSVVDNFLFKLAEVKIKCKRLLQ